MAETKQTNTEIASLNELTSPPRSLFKDAWFAPDPQQRRRGSHGNYYDFFVWVPFCQQNCSSQSSANEFRQRFPPPDVGGKRTNRSSGRKILYFWY